MAGMTQAAATSQYNRHVCRVNAYTPQDNPFIQAAKVTLSTFVMACDDEGIDALMPIADEVRLIIRDTHPVPDEIYTDKFYKAGMFPVHTLHDVGTFYKCDDAPEDNWIGLGYSNADLDNRSIRNHVWLASIQAISQPHARAVVEE